jgi:hypothetical protein
MQANIVNTGEVELLLHQNRTVNQNMVQPIQLHTFRSKDASGQPHAPLAWFPVHCAREIKRTRPAESLSHLFRFHLSINLFLNINMNKRLGGLAYLNINKTRILCWVDRASRILCWVDRASRILCWVDRASRILWMVVPQ